MSMSPLVQSLMRRIAIDGNDIIYPGDPIPGEAVAPVELTRQEELTLENLIPRSMMMRLRQTFTVRGMAFFEFYLLLKRIEMGEPAPQDLKQQYVMAANRLIQVTSPVDHRPLSPAVINMIAESRTDIGIFLGRLASGNTTDRLTWVKINTILVPIIVAAARDKGLYLSYRQNNTRKWAIFRRMSPKAERAEMVKDENPEAYALVVRYGQSLDDITNGIKQRIKREGLVVEEAFLAGRTVMYGVNPTTQEKHVYDLDGSVLTTRQFIDKRTALNKENAQLSKAHNRTTFLAEELRTVSDEDIDRLTGPVEMVSVTDDKVKQGRMTRIFPIRRMSMEIEDSANPHTTVVKVIVSGRFKGCLLDDVINSTGRMVEGTSYAYNPETGQSHAIPKRIDTSNREPYVTVGSPEDIRVTPDGETVKTQRNRLYVRIPKMRHMLPLREALKTLACNSPAWYQKKGCIPSIEWVQLKESNAAGFFFDAKDFGTVMDVLKSMSLSKEALALVKDYYKDLVNAEAATVKTNLSNYTVEAIGGFKSGMLQGNGSMRSIVLSTKQKKSLAWMDANGNKGVCGLDTGTGKTLVSICTMLKMIRDGQADPDASYTTPRGKEVKTNGRFLYVSTKALKGNLPSEMKKFVSDAPTLIARTDRMTYGEFRNAVKKAEWKGHPWVADAYVAIFFDEAQELIGKSRTRPEATADAALSIYHPHKICLTASPINSDPMEAYILACVCNNKPLTGRSPTAQANHREMRRFRERFCESVGGRILGIREDANTKRDLATWVRRNIFFADKQDADLDANEKPLTQLRDGTQAITMDPGVEQIYRTTTQSFAASMGLMVKWFRDRDIGRGKATDTSREAEAMIRASFAMAPIMKMINGLSNYPADTLRDIATIIETKSMTNAKGLPVPVPSSLKPLLKLNPDDLRVIADRIGNPKIEAAADIVAKRLKRSDGGSRTLLFSDDKKMCWKAAQYMADNVGGVHALALDTEIHLFNGGSPMTEYVIRMDEEAVRRLFHEERRKSKIPESTEQTDQRVDNFIAQHQGVARIPLPFRAKSYKQYPDVPGGKGNAKFMVGEWQTFALKLIAKDVGIKSVTMLGQTYQFGQNLQEFNTVVHLDRDTWNSEAMKQRTARSWRQGQDSPVTEITLDTVYEESRDEYDATLDTIRRQFQEMGNDLFNTIIKGAQTLALGQDWANMTKEQASLIHLDRKILDLAMSPYSSRSLTPKEIS